jgi:hypothetical protein
MQRPPNFLALPADVLRAVAELGLARIHLGKITGKSVIARNNAAKSAALKRDRNEMPAFQKQIEARIAYVIPRVAARLPWRSDCLVQALAGQRWLRTHNFAGEIRIGAAKSKEGAFTAHAWLSYDGHTILGGDISGYSQLLGSDN